MVKRQDIELVRILSALGIVWFHSQITSAHELAHSGLVIFLIISIYLGWQNKDVLKASFRKKLFRLIVPWLFWFIIYGLINIRKGSSFIPEGNDILSGMLAGPSIHLWYLPFIFVSLMVVDILKLALDDATVAIASAVISIILFSSVKYWHQESIQLGQPYEQYAHALPSIFLGLFLATFRGISGKLRIALVVLLLALIVSNLSIKSIGIPYFVGFLVCVTLASHVFSSLQSFDISRLSKFMFGIYLVHILVLRVCSKFISVDSILLPVSAFIVSGIFVMITHWIAPRVFKTIM